TQNFVPATSSPLLSGSGYNFITLKWNTSVDVSGSIAFYILQVHLNSQSPENSMELRPSIPKYVMVKGSSTNLQSFTVENLVNGFDYRFRVAAIGWNGTMNSEYSNWSPWYSTS
ncbi:---NA---, partial [Paramuricea clavata]